MDREHSQRFGFATSLGLASCWILGLPALPSQQEPSWVQQSPTTNPSERTGHAMVYNPGRGTNLMFGGLSATNTALGDTWEWIGFDPANPIPPYRGNWTQRGTGPSARYGHAMAWDGLHAAGILFGGRSTTTHNNETWALTVNAAGTTTWTQRNPTVRPPARSGHALVYDSTRQVIVLFGGTDGTNLLADTWEYDGTNWAPKFPAAFPAPRAYHAMAYDPARQRVVLFGGSNAALAVTYGSTWVYDGTIWVNTSPAVSPPPRSDAALVFDDLRDVLVLFGGSSWFQNDDTWEWNGTAWQQRQPQIPRPAPRRAVGSFNVARGRTVLFGGELTGGVRVNDTWEYFFPSGYTTFGSGCAGSTGLVALLSTRTVPALLGTTAEFLVNNTPLNAVVLMITGFSDTWWNTTPLPVELAALGMSGCHLHVSADATTVVLASGNAATYQMTLPGDPAFLGFVFYNQALVLDPAAGNPFGGVMSNAGMTVIGH